MSASRSDLGARRSRADASIYYDHEGPRKSLSSRWIKWGVEYRLGLPNSFVKKELDYSPKQSARSAGGGSDPLEESVNRAPLCAPVNLVSCRTSGQKGGVAPSTSTPLVRRAGAPGEGGKREAQPRFALSQRTRKMLVIPRPMPRFGKMPNHNGEGLPSEREALWLSKACATCVRHQVFFSGALIRRHRRDPQRRKSSIHPAPAEAAMAFDGGAITSASFPPAARLRTRRLILLGTLMEKEVPSAALLAKLYQALNRDQDQALFGLRPQSSAGTDRTPALAFAPLESWRPVRLPDGSWGAPTRDLMPRPCPGVCQPHHHCPGQKRQFLGRHYYRGRRAHPQPPPGPHPKTQKMIVFTRLVLCRPCALSTNQAA